MVNSNSTAISNNDFSFKDVHNEELFLQMFAIFLFVRTMNKVRDKKPANTHECPYCKSTINNAATKCPFCCSVVETVETEAVVESDLKKGIKEVTKLATNVADGALNKIKKIKKITKH